MEVQQIISSSGFSSLINNSAYTIQVNCIILQIYFKLDVIHLRLIYHFSVFVKWLKSKCCFNVKDIQDPLKIVEAASNDYWNTLNVVMEEKFQADYENSTQDSFADLKMDLKNIIKDNQSNKDKLLREDIRRIIREELLNMTEHK